MTRYLLPPIVTGCAALFAIGVLVTQSADAATARREPNGAIRYFDDNGNDAGYAWCLRRDGGFTPGRSGSDCSYFTLEQCRASIITPASGICEPNPFASQVRQGTPRR